MADDEAGPWYRRLGRRIRSAADEWELKENLSCCLSEVLFGLLTPLSLLRLLSSLVRPAGRSVDSPRGLRGLLWRRIRAYQVHYSAHSRAVCRLSPTCSHYAQEVLAEYGVVRGMFFVLRRLIVRCGRVASDPVPTRQGGDRGSLCD